MYRYGYKRPSLVGRFLSLGVLALGLHMISKVNVGFPGTNVATAVERKLDSITKTNTAIYTNTAFNTVPFNIYQ